MSGNGWGVGGSMRRSTASSQSQKMEMPKLQARISAPFPPPHKTQLPPRYQVNSSPSSAASFWRPSCRRNAWIILALLLLLSFCLYLLSITARGVLMSAHFRRAGAASSSPAASDKRYAIIIDAGSSGSRLHVFQYTHASRGAVPLVNTRESLSRKTRPGLSSFAASPADAGRSLAPLLDFARERVPEPDRPATRLFLMATAGLRLLTPATQTGIIDSCRALLRDAGFSFREDWASVISGTEEGIFAWIAANYALGTLGGQPHDTTGIVELGGASAQVTFVPEEVPPPAFRHDLSLLGVSYSLYTYSFLQYGQEAAWDRLVEMMTSGAWTPEFPALEKGVVMDPCTPRGYVPKQTSPISLVIEDSNGAQKPVVKIQSAGNFTACRIAALGLLQKGSDGCLYEKCAIGSAFVPALRGRFFATENFFYTSEFFGLPPSSSLADVAAAGQHYCGENWKALQQKHDGMETDDLLKYCFSTAYIVALLHDTLGVDMHDARVRFTNQVEDVHLDWALGALIFQLDGDSFPEDPSVMLFREGASRFVSIVGCIAALGFLAWFIMRCRRPHVKTIYDLEKGRYITTAARSHR